MEQGTNRLTSKGWIQNKCKYLSYKAKGNEHAPLSIPGPFIEGHTVEVLQWLRSADSKLHANATERRDSTSEWQIIQDYRPGLRKRNKLETVLLKPLGLCNVQPRVLQLQVDLFLDPSNPPSPHTIAGTPSDQNWTAPNWQHNPTNLMLSPCIASKKYMWRPQRI